MTRPRLSVGVLLYTALFNGTWWMLISGNQNEDWFEPLSYASWVFLPIALPTFAICEVVWGSLNIFQARPVIGYLSDVAVVSVAWAITFLLIVGFVQRRLQSHRSGVGS